MTGNSTYCGFVAIVGRPNVGKSTLLNQLVGEKISITSSKPHTTQNCIMGIYNKEEYQTIYIDTPGWCIKKKHIIHNVMQHHVMSAISDSTLVLFMIEGLNWTFADQEIIKNLQNKKLVLLVINKIDTVLNKSLLLSYLEYLDKKRNFIGIVPISAKTRNNIKIINNIIRQYLPQEKLFFQKKCVTNCSPVFIVSEIIREKIIRNFGAELPYSVVVNVEKFTINTSNILIIHALILVSNQGQKKIIIGSHGNKIKIIGILARQDIEKIFKRKVCLKSWIKIKPNIAENLSISSPLEYNYDTFLR
ncbi:GTPase Era [Candidatus Erwinia haradaeae]|uniref:GTPase Era n=1 Tax=Candidatus Erwinia haradaeae TaxID=1922217 RepID=A0A451D1N5_9GAMM|nr:GTPase Era [Candidatus Erwinia haradaeae]VFP79525.1 GTPase Era [Candidatus Erwinia haradaeae]